MTLITVLCLLSLVAGGALLFVKGLRERDEEDGTPDHPLSYQDHAANERRKNVRTFQKRGTK